MEEIKEAKVIEETEKIELTKPEFKSEIKAELKGITQIEDNINDVKEYALKLSDYYSIKEFDEDTLKDAKNERAEVNKFKDKVADFRKEITKKFNEPLEKFTTTAKETEKILKETYDTINSQIKAYEDKQKEEKEEEVKSYFTELCEAENIDFVNYEQANINVTLSASMKSLKEQAKKFVNKVVDDINLINSTQFIDEIMIDYKKDLNVSRAITEVNNRHAELEKVKQQKEEQQEQKLNDEEMLNRIDNLSAPKVENVQESSQENDPLVTATFKYTCRRSVMVELVKFMKERGGELEQLK